MVEVLVKKLNGNKGLESPVWLFWHEVVTKDGIDRLYRVYDSWLAFLKDEGRPIRELEEPTGVTITHIDKSLLEKANAFKQSQAYRRVK